LEILFVRIQIVLPNIKKFMATEIHDPCVPDNVPFCILSVQLSYSSTAENERRGEYRKGKKRTVVLLAPREQGVTQTHGDTNVESLSGNTTEGVEDSLVSGTGKGTLLIGRESVDGNSTLLGGAQMSPPTHPFT
jgi:hypothetical protein